jgi:ATP-dependent DNA ligase
MLQPKWDGFRLLIEVDDDRHMRASSRHGTSLTTRLGGVTAAFAEALPGSVFDGELVAVSERDGRPMHFAMAENELERYRETSAVVHQRAIVDKGRHVGRDAVWLSPRRRQTFGHRHARGEMGEVDL